MIRPHSDTAAAWRSRLVDIGKVGKSNSFSSTHRSTDAGLAAERCADRLVS